MDWISCLDQIVRSHWSSTGKAFLLSWIPGALAKHGVDLPSVLRGRKLKDAIQEEGRSVLRAIRHPDYQLVWAIVPIDAPATNLKDLFPFSKQTDALAEKDSVRFGRAVWSAFSKPLKPHQRRYLEIGPPSKMYDLAESEPPPPLGLEVDPSLIYGAQPSLVPIEERDEHIERTIRKWAADHKIPIDKLTPANRLPTIGEYHDATIDLIDFSDLSPAEKGRILIPLDILPKLRFRKK